MRTAGAVQTPIQEEPMGTKQLVRRHDNRWIAGVAGGLADYWGIDALAVRLGFIILGLVTFGTAFWAYLICWLLIPDGVDGSKGLDAVKRTINGFRDKNDGPQDFNPYDDTK
ncbi:PspC domain-containing protein [Propionibacterium freudenreichii]|uniref:Possible stress-response transcriptional regulator protein PspC n=3 Tax=Propionibacterium freudenreichii TaxID=1744 RepID=D7GCE1_PROFC|nr:PspC domain-containing protein [Propionibacterium freudenreichii]MDN5961964.1 PspC domain-containing protein [Propionibacterium sp.]ARO11566.1 hypothetical protein BMR99_02585 [Propionibacterium freudenreichii]MCQ1996954.1 PspC domain-containing protein [Propionibacterium freudenreichii]MCT2973226.1 PspC domain-containing protein [Propionibacterium freudenreichii]MCT2975199.1 PspC domain-containing protein [Propionibacterium freudenreichii]